MCKQNILGIELGSTRIKAVLMDKHHNLLSKSAYTWKSSCENGIWTYSLNEVWKGLRSVVASIGKKDGIAAIGVSGMMHGYLVFDKDWNLLVPFRTWQNTNTGRAAADLTKLFRFHIPQRWSIAHLYQAILNKEDHVEKIAHITTLSGYVHYMLTGVNAVGIGEASGMFPIDCEKYCYDKEMLKAFNAVLKSKNISWTLSEILPDILTAGEEAGRLTPSGASLLGNELTPGILFAPPEGDAGTGMTATNAVLPGTGNISAGTSIFSMVVLEHSLQNLHEEIDIVTTPTGKPVAMVHCNNCTNDINEWTGIFRELLEMFDVRLSDEKLYTALYKKSLEGNPDCGGILVCNYLAGEEITHMDLGRPIIIRRPDSNFNLANFLRSQLYAAIATLRIGVSILEQEGVNIYSMVGHGGFFKTPVVGQKYMANALQVPVVCMETTGEGGPYGMALLAAYLVYKNEGESLEEYLTDRVFVDTACSVIFPESEEIMGFQAYMRDFNDLLTVERAAIKNIKE